MTAPLELPPLNPFPAQATTAIEEGSFVASYRQWAMTTPTLTLESVNQLTSLTARFRRSLETGDRGHGQMVFVHGAHGTGKTHAIRAAIGAVATESTDDTLLPLYVKLSSPNFVHAYRLVMAQLSISDVTDLTLKFLGRLSASGPKPLGGQLVDVRRNPAALLEMFSAHLLERGLLLEAQADRLHDVVSDESNFQRALTYLLEPDLKNAAFRWLQGREVADIELRRLGITGSLDSLDQCRYGLQLLTLICREAGRPLVLMLDQAEKYLLDSRGLLIPDSAGLIHSLVEAIPDIGGMLVVASNDEAWAALPLDLRQRFAPNDLTCHALQPGQAIELLGLYVLAVVSPELHASYRSPWPFSDAAVEKLLRNSGGNLRSLLQLSWQSFDRAAEDTAAVIDAVDVPDDVVVFDRQSVDMSVRRALWRLGPMVVKPKPGFDYAVSMPGSGRLLVRVSEAMFYLDEAEQAEEDILARMKAAAAADGPRDTVAERHILLVVGYASRDVTELLAQVYDEVLVYRDGEEFFETMRQFMVPEIRTSVEGDASVNYATVHGEIANLGWHRSRSLGGLQEQFVELNHRYGLDQLSRRFDDLAQRWLLERERLVSRIAEARQQRQQVELEEFHRVALGARQRRWIVRGPAVVALVILCTVGLALTTETTVGQLIAGAGLSVGLFGLVVALLERHRASTTLPPVSLAEINRIARSRLIGFRRSPLESVRHKFRQWFGDSFLPWELASLDPYVRYGQVVWRLPNSLGKNFLAALNIERVAIIRRSLADRLGRRLEWESWSAVVDPHRLDASELPYVVQHHHRPYWNEISGLDAQCRLLAALSAEDGQGVQPGSPANPLIVDQRAPTFNLNPRAMTSDSGKRQRRPTSETNSAVRQVVRAANGMGDLGAAYRQGVDFGSLPGSLNEINDRDLRRVEELLSPFTGLGANDHLLLSGELERLYLFFQQLLYFRESGLEFPAAPDSEP